MQTAYTIVTFGPARGVNGRLYSTVDAARRAALRLAGDSPGASVRVLKLTANTKAELRAIALTASIADPRWDVVAHF